MTSDATPLFDDGIYTSTVDFSENTEPEPPTRNSVTWLSSHALRAAASIAITGMLTIAASPINVSKPVVYTRVVKTSPWDKSPRVSPAILAAAAAKSKLFVHAPHGEGGLKHPDID